MFKMSQLSLFIVCNAHWDLEKSSTTSCYTTPHPISLHLGIEKLGKKKILHLSLYLSLHMHGWTSPMDFHMAVQTQLPLGKWRYLSVPLETLLLNPIHFQWENKWLKTALKIISWSIEKWDVSQVQGIRVDLWVLEWWRYLENSRWR